MSSQAPTKEELDAMIAASDIEVSDADKFLIQWGFKEDPRVRGPSGNAIIKDEAS